MTALPLDRAAVAPSFGSQLAGRILTGIVTLFLAFDTGIKLAGSKAALDGTVQLGYKPHHVLIIGLIALGCLILYLIPRTAVLGAVLWTAYFGGAVATQLRLDNPLFSYILAPVYIATAMWLSLYLRDPRVRALIGPAR